MKEYFSLQYKMLNRRLIDWGVTPAVAYTLLLAVFVTGSLFLLRGLIFAEYVYVLIGVFILSMLSETGRNDFLKSCFSLKKYRKIRITENMLIAIPFILFLLIKSFYLAAGILFVLSMILAWVHFKVMFNITIPTPFYKKPFEFTVGFRNSFLLFPVMYYMVLMSIVHDNFNLGIVVLILLFINSLSYYLTPEPEYYVWSYSLSAKSFLLEKIKTALLFSTCLSLPVALSLSIFFPAKTGFILLFLLLGYAYLIMTVFFKYSIYPRQMDLPELILVVAYIALPFIMLPLIPHFYNQSRKKLENLLK